MRKKHPAQGAVETQVGLGARHRWVSRQDTGGSPEVTQVGLPKGAKRGGATGIGISPLHPY